MRGQWATRLAETAAEGWVRAAAARPRTALAALAALLALALLAATRLSVDTDSSRMLNAELPFQARALAVNEAFPQLRNTIAIALRGENADAVDAAAVALRAALDGQPAVAGVLAGAAEPFFRRNGLLYLGTAELEDRLTRLTKAAPMLAALRADPTLAGFLGALAEAGRLAEGAGEDAAALAPLRHETAAVIEAALAGGARDFSWTGALSGAAPGPVLRVVTVEPWLDFGALNPARAAMRAVEAAVADLDPAIRAGVEIGLTGDPVLRAEELRSVTETLGLSLALSLALVAGLLRFGLGSLGRAGLALAALVATLVITTGFAALAAGPLNLVSVAFVVLMVGLGIDFAIHLLARIGEEARAAPLGEALGRAGQALGLALWLTAATTAAAFLAFAGTDFRGMAQLGLIGAAGVLVALAVSLTLIPAVLALAPRLAAEGRVIRLPLAGAQAPRAVFWLALALGLAAVPLAMQARFDADPMKLRNPQARSVEVYGWVAADPLTAPQRLSAVTGDPVAAELLAGRLRAAPGVGRVAWLGDLVPAGQDAKLELIDLAWPSLDHAVRGVPVRLGDAGPVDAATLAAAQPATPEGARLAAALDRLAQAGPEASARVERALFRHFPALVDRLAAQLEVGPVARDDLPAALRARFLAPDGRLRIEVAPDGPLDTPEARARFVSAVHGLDPAAGGPPDQIAGAAAAVSAAIAQATLVALAASALLAWATLARLRLVAAILLPVLLAGAVTLAAGVALGLPLNYANVIVLPLMIGIGIDAGVHIALRAEEEPALFATATPRAVLLSALTTIGAFASLGLSSHPGTASMGILLTVALLAALGMAFALTPALVRLAARHGG